MTISDLNLLGEKVLIDSSLDQTLDVLDTIETLDWTDIRDQNLKENTSFYSRFLDIIDNKIINNNFPELEGDETQRSHLLLRVLRIRTSISQYRLLDLRDDVTRVAQESQDNITKSVIEAQKTISNHLSKRAKNFEKTVSKRTQGAIQKIEPQLMTTVLTVMGVFSAIITIIMSVVITSSSWLNNANGASAVIAFIVPNLVVVSSIAILLGIIFSRKKEATVVIPAMDWDASRSVENEIKRSKRIFKGTICLIIFFTTVIVGFSLYEMKSSDEPHTRYVLSQGMYKCVEIQNSETNENELMIEFKINQKNYLVQYDKNYFHDGNLYFCEEHKVLE